MSKYENPPENPFENTINQPDTVFDALVKENLGKLKGGIDGFYDTVERYEENDWANEDATVKALHQMLDQINEACGALSTNLGVDLPVAHIPKEAHLEPNEKLYELGRWVYSFYDQSYPWGHLA